MERKKRLKRRTHTIENHPLSASDVAGFDGYYSLALSLVDITLMQNYTRMTEDRPSDGAAFVTITVSSLRGRPELSEFYERSRRTLGGSGVKGRGTLLKKCR